MSLKCTRRPNETWRDCLFRYGKEHRIEGGVLQEYERLITEGLNPAQACWAALYEWDCLDFVDD